MMGFLTAAVIVLQHDFTALFVVFALVTGVYSVSKQHLVRGLETTDEKLSLQECLASGGRTFSTFNLWLLEMGMLSCAIGGIVLLVLAISKWSAALGMILFGGLGAAQFAYLLALRSRGGC
jgi:hypothetical protein